VALYRGIPFEVTLKFYIHRFYKRNAIVAVYTGALYGTVVGRARRHLDFALYEGTLHCRISWEKLY
jgi:hypothetical protein